jgi:amino acid transporter
VNEETADPHRTPGRAAVLSTLILLATYVLVIVSVQAFAGIGNKGVGLGNPNNQNDVLSVLGHAVFGTATFGNILFHLLLLMVLSSAAASTQTTILPTARTVLAMGVYKAVPKVFAKTHRKFLTPTWSTVLFGLVSIGIYLALNFVSAGTVIADSVSALGVMIAFYYGLTGFESVWYFRSSLSESSRNLWFRGILPLIGALMLWGAMFYSLWYDYQPNNSYTNPININGHKIGTIFVIDFVTIVVGIVLYVAYRLSGQGGVAPPFFTGAVLNKDTPTLVPEGLGHEVGMFGIEQPDNVGTA